MQTDISTPTRIMLQEEWTMEGVVERRQFLVGEFALLLEAELFPSRVDLDMTLLTGIDACGCQLLTVFQEHLKRHGIDAALCNIPTETLENIRFLGFSDALAGSEKAEKETS